jgi:PEP-CTERM motif
MESQLASTPLTSHTIEDLGLRQQLRRVKGLENMIGAALKNLGNIVRPLAIAATAIVAITGSVARAQNSWSLGISEKELKLENPTDMMWDKWLMWDIGFQRMVARNSPYIELSNAAGSTSAITEFHITIGDNRFNFGNVEANSPVMLGSTTPGFALTGNTLNGAGDELVVSIGNGGLLPGDTVRFKIKLDVDPAYAATYAANFGSSLPDFRTVLFDMNGNNVYDGTQNVSSADNSQAFVIFTPGGKGSTATFEDETVAAGQFFNNNLREYRAMDPVLIFNLEGSQIPEPASVGLAMIGLAAVGLMRSRIRH